MQKTTEYRNAGVIHGEHKYARILFFGAAFRQKAHSAFGIWETEKTMSGEERTRIKEQCGDAVEFHDYTGYFSNLGGRLSLTELLSTIHGPVVIEVDGQEKSYEDGTAALKSLTDKYEVKEIVGQTMKIKLTKSQTDKGEALKAAYAAVMGDEAGGQS